MSMNLVNLDAETRRFMLEEVEHDIAANNLYLSQRFTDRGAQEYPDLLKEAVRIGDDSTLAGRIRAGGLMNDTEQRRTKTGVTTAKVPVTAPDTLAEGEFNRFYMRGLCCRALANGIEEVKAYRAKEVSQPRPESQRPCASS